VIIPKLAITHYALRTTYYAAFFGLVCILAACGGGRAGYTAEQQTVNGITIKLEHPQQLALLQQYELFVTLTGADGRPIDGAIIFMEQDMPAMPMNSNQPLGQPLGNGQYRITGVFSMEGAWRLVIHAKVAGQEYAATFDQTVTPQP
jgi:hypothetical protein